MTRVHAYLARIKEQEKEVIAVSDGAGRALCVSSDKHWTLTREWDELHIIAPLVEGAAKREWDACNDRLDRQAQSISTLQGDFLRVERERDDLRRQVEDLHKRRRKHADERAAWTRNRRELISERDAAVARAEAAEKRHSWPKVTPTGHTYVEPRTYEALCHEHDNAAQAEVECWAADECPPEPTWEMVGIAHREVERLQRDRDEWKREHDRLVVHGSVRGDTYAAMVRDRDDWRDKAYSASEGMRETTARAEAAEARTTPAVTRDDIERVIRGEDLFERQIDAVWSLVSGDDPAVFVVRESDLPEVWRDNKHNLVGELCRHWWTSDGDWAAHQDSDAREARTLIPNYLRKIAGWEATARAIEAEAEQAKDPVETKARELRNAAQPDAGLAWEALSVTAQEQYLRMARHVLGQEAGDE